MEQRFSSDRIRGRRARRQAQQERPIFPPAAKYAITYTKANGETVDYVMSNPIEEDAQSVTAYVFGRGVRTFIKSRVQRLSQVS